MRGCSSVRRKVGVDSSYSDSFVTSAIFDSCCSSVSDYSSSSSDSSSYSGGGGSFDGGGSSDSY